MVALIDEMEARLLLERRPNPEDRRARAIYLTGAGRKMLGRAIGVALEMEESVCSALDAGERAQLSELLGRIVDDQGLVAGVHPGLNRVGPCP
jgi:DNA-binding MarR family transcriptional regulator